MLKEARSELQNRVEARIDKKETTLRKADLLLVVDGDDLLLRKHGFALSKTGLFNVAAEKGTANAWGHLKAYRCDLLLADLSCGRSKDEIYSFIERFRATNGRSAIAVMSANPQPDDLYRAAKLGISDFLIKGPCLDIAAEALRILNRKDTLSEERWPVDIVRRTGLFRSAGLSKQEIDVIAEFSKDFPRYGELAERMGKTQTHINKTFSRIYEKLSAAISIDNPSQLTHLITVCSLFK